MTRVRILRAGEAVVRRPRRTSGFVLPIGLVLSVALLALGFALSSNSRYQLLLAQSLVRAEQAQAAADGGLVVGLLALAASDTYTGTGAVALGSGPETYQISVVRAGSSISGGQSVPTGCVYVASLGRAGRASRTSAALVKLGSTSSGFKGLYAILGTTISLSNGASVNSYNSLTGKTGLSNGSVATNSAGRGSVRLLGGADIFGPVVLGPNATVESKPIPDTVGLAYTFWHDKGTNYGKTTVMTKPVEIPAVQMPNAGSKDLDLGSKAKTLDPGVYDEVEISNGAELKLAPGTYVFNKLDISGGAKITVSGSGPVKIFIHEQFELRNGAKLSDQDDSRPQYLQVYLGPESTYKQSGSSTLTGIVYGPGVDIDISNGADIYGAVVGGDLTLKGSAKVSYDETLSEFALGDVSPGTGTGTGTQSVLFRQRY